MITGETGAGKTMLAHALDLLLGGKPRRGIVRPGADEAYVEGVFEPPPGFAADPELAELAERIPLDETSWCSRRRVAGRADALVPPGPLGRPRRAAGGRRRACSRSSASTSTAS